VFGWRAVGVEWTGAEPTLILGMAPTSFFLFGWRNEMVDFNLLVGPTHMS
jgi:hypothetical protein